MADKESRVPSVLTSESIRVIGETVGVAGLSDEAASFLAEDISYRLKMLVQVILFFYISNKLIWMQVMVTLEPDFWKK